MKNSELILNADGSIYHLALLPEDISKTIILVGDPDRVPLVSQHFDQVEVKKQKREFVTHTGWFNQKRISVISTGIGTDNIDIVVNELDALVNIDLNERKVKSTHSALNLIRIGTSGSIHPDVHCDDLLISRYAIGMDLLGHYYNGDGFNRENLPSWSYLAKAHEFDLGNLNTDYKEGITLTCAGFYAPQGRSLRLPGHLDIPLEYLHKIEHDGFMVSNIEMESAGIYLLASKLGHRAVSCNVILAERLHGKFSADPYEAIQNIIKKALPFATTLG